MGSLLTGPRANRSIGFPLDRRTLFLALLALAIVIFAAPSADAQVHAYITNADSNSVSVIDTSTSQVVATIPVGFRPVGVAVDRTGSRIYVTNFDSHTVSVIDGSTNSVIAGVPVGTNPNGVAVSPDGSRLYVANQGDDTVSVVDTTIPDVVDTIFFDCSLTVGVACTPDGSRVYVSCAGDPDAVVALDPTSNTIASLIPLAAGANPKGVSVSPDGSMVYAALAARGQVAMIDTATDQLVGLLSVDPGPQIAAVHPSDGTIYVSSFTAGTVNVINPTTFESVALLGMGRPLGVDLTPDGSRLYVADSGNGSSTVYVLDAQSHVLLNTVTVGNRPHAFGKFIRAGSMQIEVVIDIVPGNRRNNVPVRGRGAMVEVAILGSATFNVADVDPERVAFGPWEAAPRHDLSHPDTRAEHLDDVNQDGFVDLLLHFAVGASGIRCGDEEATLAGATVAGQTFAASDAIVTAGCGQGNGNSPVGRARGRSGQNPRLRR